MEMNGFFGGLFKLGEWVFRLVYVNILWMLFTLLGVVVLGFMPSTVALFTVMRKWMNGEEDIPVFRIYKKTFKEEFKKANVIGVFLGGIVLVFYVDYRVIVMAESTLFQLLALLFIVILALFSLMCIYIFPIMAHYDLKLFEYFKSSFLLPFLSPLSTIMMMIALFFTGVLMIIVPGLIPLFGASAVAFVIMAAANQAFSKVKRKVKNQQAS